MTEGDGAGPGLVASGLIYILPSEKSGVSHFPVSAQLDTKPPIYFIFLRVGSKTSGGKKVQELLSLFYSWVDSLVSINGVEHVIWPLLHHLYCYICYFQEVFKYILAVQRGGG